MTKSKNRVWYYGMAFLVLLLYLSLSYWFSFLVPNTFVATLLADGMTCLFCFFLIQSKLPKNQAKPYPHTFWFLVFAGFTLYVIFTVTYWYLSRFMDTSILARQQAFSHMSAGQLLVLSLLVAPITEEVIMRLTVYRFMAKGGSWLLAMFISALVFALLHGTRMHIFSAFWFGMLCVALYEWTKKWWASILLHVLNNTFAILPMKSLIFYQNTVFVLGLLLLDIMLFVFVLVYLYLKKKGSGTHDSITASGYELSGHPSKS